MKIYKVLYYIEGLTQSDLKLIYFIYIKRIMDHAIRS